MVVTELTALFQFSCAAEIFLQLLFEKGEKKCEIKAVLIFSAVFSRKKKREFWNKYSGANMSTCCKRGCCCCCNKRDLTVLFGFILAAIAVAVPIVIHETDQEYGLTVIKFIRQYLGQNEVLLPNDQQLNQQLNPQQKYK